MSSTERDSLVERLAGFLRNRPEVLEAYLFGSQARGDARVHSDVDVAVYVDACKVPTSPYGYEASLGAELISLLQNNRVDVVVLNKAGPLLYHRVLRDGERLTSRDLAATTTREGRALSRYCDWVPHLRKFEHVLSERITRGAADR